MHPAYVLVYECHYMLMDSLGPNSPRQVLRMPLILCQRRQWRFLCSMHGNANCKYGKAHENGHWADDGLRHGGGAPTQKLPGWIQESLVVSSSFGDAFSRLHRFVRGMTAQQGS